MNRILDTGRIGCYEEKKLSWVHTIPNHHPPKRDVLPITFLQIILAAKWLLHPPTSSYNRCPSYSLIDTLYFNSCTTFLNKKIGFLTSNRCCTSFVVIWTTGDHYAIFFLLKTRFQKSKYFVEENLEVHSERRAVSFPRRQYCTQ